MSQNPFPNCRIGKIKPKGNLEVVRPQTHKEFQEWREALKKTASSVADASPELVGFVLVGLELDGTCRYSFQNSERSPVPSSLMPAYVADVLRGEVFH